MFLIFLGNLSFKKKVSSEILVGLGASIWGGRRCSDEGTRVRRGRGSLDLGWFLGAHFFGIMIQGCRLHAPFETCLAPFVNNLLECVDNRHGVVN